MGEEDQQEGPEDWEELMEGGGLKSTITYKYENATVKSITLNANLKTDLKSNSMLADNRMENHLNTFKYFSASLFLPSK